MKDRKIRKFLVWTISIFLLLVIALVFHIGIALSGMHPDEHTRVMARIDIHQPIASADSTKITAWLYRQTGMDHVMCNPRTSMVVFTYSPFLANADRLTEAFKQQLSYPLARRYVPTEKQMQGGCPVASTSFTYRLAVLVKKYF